MASGSHGTGHGVAVGRGRSGRRLSGVGRFFRFRPLLAELLLQQAHHYDDAGYESYHGLRRACLGLTHLHQEQDQVDLDLLEVA